MLLKRCADTVVSLLLVVLLLPVFAAVAFAVLLESGRPILFLQERVGLRFQKFQIIKFRTMRVGAGPLVTAANDCRITRIGGVLRRTKLDELPQLWNVLRGDMSFVGPRPEVPQYVDLYRHRYQSVLAVRPGITDLASIRFRNEEELLSKSVDPLRVYVEKVLPAKLDLADEYVRTRSTFGDVVILFRTAIAIIRGR